jgi:maleylacetate reductase
MPKRDFVVQGPTSRVVFGRGCMTGGDAIAIATAAEEIRALGCRRLVLIGSPRAQAAIGGLRAQLEAKGVEVVGVVDDLEGQHVPAGLVQRVAADVARWGADCLVSVSGGTSIGVAKAVAVAAAQPEARKLAVVCIPTTYSGSEVTAYYGVKEEETGQKVAKRDEAARPRLVLYDPVLLASLPRGLAVASIFNALAHAFEVLWLPRAAPQSVWAAREAVRVLLGALPALRAGHEHPTMDTADELLYGAYLAAYALDAESLGLQHRLAHVLGGDYALPHAQAHAAILPYVVHYHAETLPTELLDALGTADVAGRVYDAQRATVRAHACCVVFCCGVVDSA